ncbi:MAG: radical SAM protein [Deltaproteobacteria bacterium]|nr:radical SAM protein [Deltaproteobacteria bacterium]RLA90960.1 MAG: radical SAM protein [Deltaproteobacteria bacterium]
MILPSLMIGKKAKCLNCGKESRKISSFLSLCRDCIINHFDELKPIIMGIHARARKAYNLPPYPPRSDKGVKCSLCANQCVILKGEKGYCGLRENIKGRLHHISGTTNKGLLSFYFDPLPTNCVASFVCPAEVIKDKGWERYSYSKGAEYGYKNLAVFYESCSLNCLFCQNYHFKEANPYGKTISSDELVSQIDSRTACICFFGGDPSTQAAHAINSAKKALIKTKGRPFRICFETNGQFNPKLMIQAAKLSYQSFGIVKFDLKAFDERIHIALTGISNKQILKNFKVVYEIGKDRREVPLLIASTLLIPGYVEEDEVRKIARFIASIDPEIPYSLLAFYPHFFMDDMPTTKRETAELSLQAAKEEGLKNVHIGNIHLLA